MNSLRIKAHLARDGFTLDIDCAIPLDGVTALFGRSGCGKTTLLRIAAGLEKVSGAEVVSGNEVWQQGKRFIPLHKRRIGLVFQEPSLLPHLNVRDNMLYGYRRTPQAERRLHLPEVANMLSIADLLERPASQLSGGQRQRVSLGRALLTSPRLMLLDEPLSALDTQTKREIMPFLSRLAAEAGVPMIMITHAPDEVARLADRVAFMRQGRIERIERVADAHIRPDSPLFEDEGAATVLQGQLHHQNDEGLWAFGPPEARLWIGHAATPSRDKTNRLRILARDVSLALDDPTRISIQNHLQVHIQRLDRLPDGRVRAVCLLADGQQLLAELTQGSARRLNLQVGQQVFALIKSVALL